MPAGAVVRNFSFCSYEAGLFLLDSRFKLLYAAGAQFGSEVSPLFTVLEAAASRLFVDVGGGSGNEVEVLAASKISGIRVQALRNHDNLRWLAFARAALPLWLLVPGLLCRSLAGFAQSFLEHYVVERSVEELPLCFHVDVFRKLHAKARHLAGCGPLGSEGSFPSLVLDVVRLVPRACLLQDAAQLLLVPGCSGLHAQGLVIRNLVLQRFDY